MDYKMLFYKKGINILGAKLSITQDWEKGEGW
jgi:hypothetical protein